MMIGEYPCCGGDLHLWLENEEGVDLPKVGPEDCPHCGARVWHKFSRVDPCSWTEKDFLADWIVDDETKSIKPRNSENPDSPPVKDSTCR